VSEASVLETRSRLKQGQGAPGRGRVATRSSLGFHYKPLVLFISPRTISRRVAKNTAMTGRT
jgi:hypothetical protein